MTSDLLGDCALMHVYPSNHPSIYPPTPVVPLIVLCMSCHVSLHRPSKSNLTVSDYVGFQYQTAKTNIWYNCLCRTHTATKTHRYWTEIGDWPWLHARSALRSFWPSLAWLSGFHEQSWVPLHALHCHCRTEPVMEVGLDFPMDIFLHYTARWRAYNCHHWLSLQLQQCRERRAEQGLQPFQQVPPDYWVD